MKTRSFTILFFFLACYAALFLTHCTKDKPACNKSTENHVLSDSDKGKIPYTGSDTIVLISNTGDTATCIGSGKITDQVCEDGGGNPDCPAFTYSRCYENNIWDFKDVKKDFNTHFELTQAKNVLDYRYHRSSAYDFLISINNNYNFYIYTSLISAGSGNNLGRVNFNGKDYDDVCFFYKNINDTTSKIYYNTTQGLIRIELNNQSQTWTLK